MSKLQPGKNRRSRFVPIAGGVLVVIGVLAATYAASSRVISYERSDSTTPTHTKKDETPPPPPLDKVAYDKKMLELAHVDVQSPWYGAFMQGTSTPIDAATGAATTTKIAKPKWPVKRAYPNAGALLPFNRIIAYYGNFLSTGMGVLGKYPPQEMLRRLASTTAQWQEADPSTPAIPALHLIIVTAQASAGSDGMYRARMSDELIDKALALAEQIHGIVFLDFQVGFSTVDKELPQYEKYLAMPNVHVGIDPEFSMKGKYSPGHEIGTFDATDINWTASYLAGFVRKHNLPPKILMVHRFTYDMVTNAKRITPLPEVQFVMDMDGWGDPAKKIGTYTNIVAAEPVQFTGFKLFYKNDVLPPSTGMMTPGEVLSLTPAPVYIQYQ